MKKIVTAAAVLLTAVSFPSQAAEVIGVFDTQGNCNAAWNALNNATRKDLRQSGHGVSQKELNAMGLYYCAPSGDFWLLIKA